MIRLVAVAAVAWSAGAIAAPRAESAVGTAAQATSQEFSEALYATCMKSGGDMDQVLGRKL